MESFSPPEKSVLWVAAFSSIWRPYTRNSLPPCARRWKPTVAARCTSTPPEKIDRKSTRLNSSHVAISYAVFCLKKKKATEMSEAGELNVGQLVRERHGAGALLVWF